MANYNVQISWSGKDSLPDSDPAKVISGADFQTEFDAVKAAINSKAELSTILNAIYPVGSIYTNATNNINPATLLGFGTWTAFGAGRVPVGFDASNSNFNASEKTGGSANAIVVSHTHTATVTDPGHDHNLKGGFGSVPDFLGGSGKDYGAGIGSDLGSSYRVASATTGITVANSTTGSSGTNANLQPYITVYMWKRTA